MRQFVMKAYSRSYAGSIYEAPTLSFDVRDCAIEWLGWRQGNPQKAAVQEVKVVDKHVIRKLC